MMTMMGRGSNGFGGSSPSPSSNLSALAPPFTVDRSMPKLGSNPLVDLTETTYGLTFNHALHNWLGPQPPNSRPDYFSSSNIESDSNAYRYSSSIEHVAPLNPLVSVSIDSDLYGQNSNNLLEAKPYYPSYVSNAIGNISRLDIPHNPGYDILSTSQVPTTNNSVHEDYTQSLSGLEHSAHWSGLWEGLLDFQQARPSQLDGSFYSKENCFNQGLYTSEGIAKFEVASLSIDAAVKEKENESGFRERDYSCLLGEIPKFVSSVCPTSTSSTSPLPVPGACPPVEPLKPVNSWSHPIQYGASYENCLRKHDTTPSDVSLVMNSSPAIFEGPVAQETSLFRKIKATSARDNKAFPSNSPCFVMEPHPCISSNPNISSNGDYKVPASNNVSVFLEPDPSMSYKSSVCCDASQASLLPEQNQQNISGFPLAKNKEISRSETLPMDSLDQVYGKRSRIQVPHASPDSSSIAGDKNEGINSVKNYSENIDHYNPAVDSPCWRGAPVSHVSHFEMAEAFSPQCVKKVEACRGPDLQVHPVSNLRGNGAENISLEKRSKNLMQHESWSGGSYLAPFYTPKDDNVLLREGTDDAAKAGSCYTKPICFTGVNVADDSLSKKLFYDPDSKLLHNEQQSCEDGKWINEKRCGQEINSTSVGINVNDPDDFSSQVPFHAIEHVLCSPPCTDYAPSKFIESHGGESTQKMYVKTLLDTMHNLSELLVFHLSNDACELKKDDYEALKHVIHNLDLCMYKTVERSERVTSQVLGNSTKHQKDPSGNGSQASGIHLPNAEAPVKYHLVQGEDDSSVSGKNDEKLSNFVPSVFATGVLKDNSTIQALKKVLIENFDAEEEKTDPQVLLYKNLWLEAEALLCSASCIARFNRIKNEMENHNCQATHGNTVMEKLSRSEVPFNQDEAGTLASDTKGSPFPQSSILSASRHEQDDVAARFNILKCRIDNSNTDNTSHSEMLGCAEKWCTSEDSPTEIVEKLGFEGKGVEQKSEMSSQDDFEDSVMSRFSILKRRDDKLSSMDRGEEEDKAACVDSGCAGKDRSEDRVSDDGMMKMGVVSKAGDQYRGGLGDGSSSDWEHVLLEELGGLSS